MPSAKEPDHEQQKLMENLLFMHDEQFQLVSGTLGQRSWDNATVLIIILVGPHLPAPTFLSSSS